MSQATKSIEPDDKAEREADAPPPAPPVKRYRLLTRAHMDGALQDVGYVFTLAEGRLGPMRAAVASDHGANHEGNPGRLVDVPLYEEVVDKPAVPEGPDGSDAKQGAKEPDPYIG